MRFVPSHWLLWLSAWFPSFMLWTIWAMLVSRPLWATVFGLVASLSLLFLCLQITALASLLNPSSEVVSIVERRDEVLKAPMFWYILPFLVQPWNGWGQAIGLAFLLLVVGAISLRGNVLARNPLLVLAGYHLYEVRIEHSARSHLLLSRVQVLPQQRVRFVRLDADGELYLVQEHSFS